MKKEIGLWIDHRQAIIVMNLDQEAEIKRIISNGENAHDDASEDGRDRRFKAHLDEYYDEVITHLQDATTLLILGPGEAKGELQTRLASHGLSERQVVLKPMDKLTDNQIVAEVRQYFSEASHTAD